MLEVELVLVVFPRSRLRLRHEIGNSLFLEMASNVANRIERLRKGKLPRSDGHKQGSYGHEKS